MNLVRVLRTMFALTVMLFCRLAWIPCAVFVWPFIDTSHYPNLYDYDNGKHDYFAWFPIVIYGQPWYKIKVFWLTDVKRQRRSGGEYWYWTYSHDSVNS